MATFNNKHQAKKAVLIQNDWFEQQQSGVYSFEEIIFKKKNQINSTVTTRTFFSLFFRKSKPERFQVQDWYPN